MQAVIMAGGFGTRLRPLTCEIPKPMVPVMNKPMLEHIIELLKQHGITDLIILLHFQPDVITGYFGDGSGHGVKIHYIMAQEDYGTAGAVRNAAEYLHEQFIVISGDLITDINLSDLMSFHKKAQSQATIALVHVKNPLAFGVVMTDKSGRVTRFLEKPSWGEVFSDTINAGIYVLELDTIHQIPFHQEFDFSRDLFSKMLREKQNLFGYVANGYWKDVGSLEEYREVHRDCLEGNVNIHARQTDREKLIEALVHAEGKCVIDNGCDFGKEVYLKNVVIGKNCKIGPYARLTNCILWDQVEVGDHSVMIDSVILSQAKIGAGVKVNENVFISNRAVVGVRAEIKENVKIWPDKIVEDGAVLNSSLIWGSQWGRELFFDSRVTGMANIEISPEFGGKLGAAFGALIGPGNTVITSRDISPASRMINRSLITGLMSAGVNVQDLTAMPIPVVRHELRSGKAKGGLHSRQSPFDAKSSDIIFFDTGGKDLPNGKTKSVERLFAREDFPRAKYDNIGDLEFPVRVTESYADDFLQALDRSIFKSKRFKVVVDYSNGASSTIFPNILGKLDCEVISLNASLDPKRLTKSAQDFQYSLDQLSTIVTSLKADIGFLMDAGGEKIFVVDDHGHYVDPDAFMVLVTKLYIDTESPTQIAIPINGSVIIDEFSRAKNVSVHRVRNKHEAMMEASLAGYPYVGGTKGGFIFSKFMFACDGMFAVAKILELMAKSGTTIGDLHKSTPLWYWSKKNIPCPWESKGKVMRQLMQYTEKMDRLLVDGIKIFLEDAAVLFLPDRERTFFHVNIEAKNQSRADGLLEEYAKLVEKWI